MKFKIAICDDEQNQIDYMASIVASWSAHAGHNCEIRTFASAEAFLFEYEEDKAFDILLLDIEMETEEEYDEYKAHGNPLQHIEVVIQLDQCICGIIIGVEHKQAR